MPSFKVCLPLINVLIFKHVASVDNCFCFFIHFDADNFNYFLVLYCLAFSLFSSKATP